MLERLKSGRVSQAAAAQELGLSVRPGQKVVAEGGGGWASRSALCPAGKKPNNWIDGSRREEATVLIRGALSGFLDRPLPARCSPSVTAWHSRWRRHER